MISNSNQQARILKRGIKAVYYIYLPFARSIEISMDGFNDPRKGNNRTYRRTINIENPKGDIFYLFDRRYKSYISPSFFRCRGENDNRESCGELSSNLSHLISAASQIQDLRRLVGERGS